MLELLRNDLCSMFACVVDKGANLLFCVVGISIRTDLIRHASYSNSLAIICAACLHFQLKSE